MYFLYETNYAEYSRKMKEMITNYGVCRPDGCINKGLNRILKRILCSYTQQLMSSLESSFKSVLSDQTHTLSLLSLFMRCN